jgi:DNA primase
VKGAQSDKIGPGAAKPHVVADNFNNIQPVYLRGEMLKSPEKRRRAADEIIAGMGSLSPVDAAPYLPRVAAAMGVFPHELASLLEKQRQKASAPAAAEKKSGAREKQGDGFDEVEAAVCALLWRDEHIRMTADEVKVLSLLSDERIQTVVAALFSASSPGELEERWHSLGETLPFRVIAGGGDWAEALGDTAAAWDAVQEILKKRRDRREYDAIKLKLSRGEATGEDLVKFREVARSLKARGGE